MKILKELWKLIKGEPPIDMREPEKLKRRSISIQEDFVSERNPKGKGTLLETIECSKPMTYVDVGKMSKKDSEKYIKELMEKHRNRFK